MPEPELASRELPTDGRRLPVREPRTEDPPVGSDGWLKEQAERWQNRMD